MRLAGALAIIALLGIDVALAQSTLAQSNLAQSKGSGSGSGSEAGASVSKNQSRPPTQPFAGQQERPVSGLSEREIADLEAGRGMGLALPAELNGYPGPMHVLEHADALQLTPDQRSKVQASFDFMQAQAQGLGRTYIEAEKALAAAFRSGRVDVKALAERIKAVEAVRSELRQVHLLAHIETAALLTGQQKAIYDALRGYIRTQATGGRGSGSGAGSGSGSGEATALCQAGSAVGNAGGCCCGGGGCGGGSMSCRAGR
jgi:Spy/CpxP family protein refolding chaperone